MASRLLSHLCRFLGYQNCASLNHEFQTCRESLNGRCSHLCEHSSSALIVAYIMINVSGCISILWKSFLATVARFGHRIYYVSVLDLEYSIKSYSLPFSIKAEDLLKLFCSHPHLQQLKLFTASVMSLTDDRLGQILSHYPKLRHISLRVDLKPGSFAAIINRGPMADYIEADCYTSQVKRVAAPAAACHLAINCHELDAERTLLQHFPYPIQSLSSNLLSSASMYLIAHNYATHLEVLSIGLLAREASLLPECAHLLGKCASLHTLAITDKQHNITDHEQLRLGPSRPSWLASLTLVNTAGITDDEGRLAYLTLLHSCGVKLEKICLKCCLLLTEVTVHKIAELFPNIKLACFIMTRVSKAAMDSVRTKVSFQMPN